MNRKPTHKEIWCIKAFGNNLSVINGDLVNKEGFVCFVDELFHDEPDINLYNDVWCADTELEAYKLLHDYLTKRDAEVVRKIQQLEAKK